MSSLLNKIITPKDPTAIIETIVAKVKEIGLYDIDDRDDLIPFLIRASIQRIEELTSLVLLPSTVQANYVQHGGGTRIELFFCNNVPKNDKGFPIFSGLPDNTGFSGIDGGYYLLLSGCQDINITYDAGFDELPEWAVLAIAIDVVDHLDNQGSENNKLSPQSLQIIQPFRRTLHEFIL